MAYNFKKGNNYKQYKGYRVVVVLIILEELVMKFLTFFNNKERKKWLCKLDAAKTRRKHSLLDHQF